MKHWLLIILPFTEIDRSFISAVWFISKLSVVSALPVRSNINFKKIDLQQNWLACNNTIEILSQIKI